MSLRDDNDRMPTATTRVPDATQVADLEPAQIARMLQSQASQIDELKRQVEWFKRQMFGRKSERFAPEPDAQQMHLGEVVGELPAMPEQPDAGSHVPAHTRRPVIKRRDTQTLHCAPAPVGVIEGSRADVSFIAGMLMDKFRWHLPLYRQHQRLIDAGFNVSRPWLTQLVQQAAHLLEPIYEAQLDSIRAGRVITMDETPIKAGQAGVSGKPAESLPTRRSYASPSATGRARSAASTAWA
jgi:transposase